MPPIRTSSTHKPHRTENRPRPLRPQNIPEGYTPTQSGKYQTHQDGKSTLYARNGNNPSDLRPATPPLGAQKGERPHKDANGVHYDSYHYNQNSIHDCLHHTEENMHNTQFPRTGPGSGRINSQVAPTGHDFGKSHTANIRASKEAKTQHPNQVNEHANPQRGDGIAVVRQGRPGENQSPYHAAPVVGRDGDHYITSEVSAPPDGRELNNRTATPKVYRYTQGAGSDSFHDHNATQGGYGTNAITVPLKKKDP